MDIRTYPPVNEGEVETKFVEGVNNPYFGVYQTLIGPLTDSTALGIG